MNPLDPDTFPPRIGAPATGAVAAAGITSYDQLATWTERDLLALHGVGPKAVRILSEALDQRGSSFAPD